MEEVAHRPVLLQEVLEALACGPGGVWVDGTVGAGGHAFAILRATSPGGRLIGFDRDAESLELARRRLEPFGDRALLQQADHRDLPRLLDDIDAPPADGILLDLGISSVQLDDAARGFSYRKDGPLDMRMDRSQTTTAADIVGRLGEKELRDLFKEMGEEPHAARIARAIVQERARAPFTSTLRLAEVIVAAVPRATAGRSGRRAPQGRRTAMHPANLSFQALRIAVNREIEYLPALLEAAVGHLKPGGRLAVIAFHSLEDRAVKQTFAALAHRCVCPRDLPRCGCGRPDLVRLVRAGAVRPGPAELLENPRARSARLRTAERLEAAA